MADTVDGYLVELRADERDARERVCRIIREAVPEAHDRPHGTEDIASQERP